MMYPGHGFVCVYVDFGRSIRKLETYRARSSDGNIGLAAASSAPARRRAARRRRAAPRPSPAPGTAAPPPPASASARSSHTSSHRPETFKSTKPRIWLGLCHIYTNNNGGASSIVGAIFSSRSDECGPIDWACAKEPRLIDDV